MPWPEGPGAQDETLFVTNPAVPASPSKPRCYDQSFLSFCTTVNSSGGSGSEVAPLHARAGPRGGVKRERSGRCRSESNVQSGRSGGPDTAWGDRAQAA